MESFACSSAPDSQPVVIGRKTFAMEELSVTDEELRKFESIQYCGSFIGKLRRLLSKAAIADGIIYSFRR
jgi:hypothetical protein